MDVAPHSPTMPDDLQSLSAEPSLFSTHTIIEYTRLMMVPDCTGVQLSLISHRRACVIVHRALSTIACLSAFVGHLLWRIGNSDSGLFASKQCYIIISISFSHRRGTLMSSASSRRNHRLPMSRASFQKVHLESLSYHPEDTTLSLPTASPSVAKMVA